MRAAAGGIRCLVALIWGLALVGGGGAVATAATPTVEQDPVAAIRALVPGESLVLEHVLITRTVQGLIVDVMDQGPIKGEESMDATVCGVALAAAIFGIGAGILGFIAAGTGAASTVVLAGYTFTGAQVGMMAAISGSYAALLAWISRYVC